MRSITLTQLTEHNACEEQVKLFKKYFGESVVVTEELAVSIASKFEFDWAAQNFLSVGARREYSEECDPVWAKFQKTRYDSFAEYEKVSNAVYAKYVKEPTGLGIEYGRKHNAAWAKHQKVRDIAWAGYCKVRAGVFAKLYNADTATATYS